MRSGLTGKLALLFMLMAATLGLPANAQEPEEPDYFFLTGGPYTQQKGSPQIIWASQIFRAASPLVSLTSYSGGGRFEIGLTDRWEFDFEFGVAGVDEMAGGLVVTDETGAADLLFGVRYRLLDEATGPFTLTLGPQLIVPVASRRRGLGDGEFGYAVDVSAARDWGGPVFVAFSVNAGVTPGVPDNPATPMRELNLTAVTWSGALGWRTLERAAGGAHHDLHTFLEVSGDSAEGIESGVKVRTTPWLFSPGIRYGYVSAGGSLTEIGFALPIGLNRDAPDWGWIVQFQLEFPGS